MLRKLFGQGRDHSRAPEKEKVPGAPLAEEVIQAVLTTVLAGQPQGTGVVYEGGASAPDARLARLTGAQLLRAQREQGICSETWCNQPIASICDVCTKHVCAFHAVLVRAEDGTMRAVCSGTPHNVASMPLLREILLYNARLASYAPDQALARAASEAQAAMEGLMLGEASGDGQYAALDRVLEICMRVLGDAAKQTDMEYWERGSDLWLRADATRDLLSRAHEMRPPAA